MPYPSARLLALLLSAALASLSGCSRPVSQRPNILLLTIDTLRADHLSSYGYPRATSPVIDRLAAEGVRFEQTAVQWPKTAPSFASIFTASYPKDNGIVRKVGVSLPLEFRMLAEELQAQGYATYAVVSNGAVASEFNFNQGFDTYIETWKLSPPGPDVDPTGAEMVTQLARLAIGDHDPERPYFLWVHYLDPHFPYTAPEPWTNRFDQDEHFDPAEKIEIRYDREVRQMTGIGADQVLDEREELAFYLARYDAEILYADTHIGKLLESLEGRQLMEKTLTVVTSDHGESLGEHEYFFDHGRFGFQTCLRVPLIFHYPGVLEPRVDSDPVELLHLAPTLLEAAGVALEQGTWIQGRSLMPRLLGHESAPPAPAYAFSEAGYAIERKWQRIVRDRRYKLIYARAGDEQRWIAGPGNPMALYDLETDPGESKNLLHELPEEAERLQRALHGLWSAPRFDVLVDDEETTEQLEMEEETRRQLKALGYLQ
jgi:arylsulfatase A-like enzyme